MSVDFATANGTAVQPGDYTLSSGTLTFAPGETSKTITVAVKGDLLDEVHETYLLNLSNASNATIADAQGLGTITDDDPTIVVESYIFYNQDAAAEKNFTSNATGQRSMIRRIQVVFNGVISVPLGSVTNNSFRLTTDTATPVARSLTVISSTVLGGKTTVVLGFTTGIQASGSLIDGNYKLEIDGGLLAVDGDSNGIVGGTRTIKFHRFFGDSDGDRDVDSRDSANYAAGLRGNSAWRSIFDFDNDGSLLNGSLLNGATQDLDDKNAFFANFGKLLNPF